MPFTQLPRKRQCLNAMQFGTPLLLVFLFGLGWVLPASGKDESISKEQLIYKTVGERELKMFLEKPADWKAEDRRPAMVFFFGGGWVGGNPKQFEPQSEYFASRGMVGIRVEYRVIPKGETGPPTVCCHDAKSAIRYVRAHADELGVDPDRIAAAGGSAGGHLAAFSSMVDGIEDPKDDSSISPRGNALVLFNPVFDNGPDGGWGHRRVGDRFREFSPAHNISDEDPAAIVFLGSQDKLMSVATLNRFQEKMNEVGVQCETRVYEGAGHGFFNREPFLSQTIIEADKFLGELGWLEGPPTRQASK